MTDTDPTTTSPTMAPPHDPRETIEERRATGQAARKQAPRSVQAHWDETARGHDALDTILAQNAIRVPELLPIRHGRMVAAPWDYCRRADGPRAASSATAFWSKDTKVSPPSQFSPPPVTPHIARSP